MTPGCKIVGVFLGQIKNSPHVCKVSCLLFSVALML